MRKLIWLFGGAAIAAALVYWWALWRPFPEVASGLAFLLVLFAGVLDDGIRRIRKHRAKREGEDA